MKVAVANENDIECISAVYRIVESLQDGYMPVEVGEESDDQVFFDIDDRDQCRRVLQMILDAAEKGSSFRAVANLVTLLDPCNEMIDPDSDVLALHPKWAKAGGQRDSILAMLETFCAAAESCRDSELGDIACLGSMAPCEDAMGKLLLAADSAKALVSKVKGGAA